MKNNRFLYITSICIFTICIYFPSIAFSNPTTLQDTLRFAFAYAPNIKAAQESRQQSVHNIRAAEAGYYPTIGIWAGVGVEVNNNINTRALDTYRDAESTMNMGLQLSQTIWQGGNTSANVRMRNEELNYRAWQLMDSANSLAYSAISAHADVIRRRILVDLAKGNVKENKRILGMLHIRFQQGLSSQGDVDLAQGRLKRAEATLSLYQQAMESAFAAYTKVTGQPVPKDLTPVSMPKRVFSNVDEARNTSVDKNIRIQTDLAAIRNALAEKDVASSNFAPRLSIDAGPSITDDSNDGDTSQITWSAMLNMRWDIYSGGRDVATVKSIAARVRQLRQNLHETMDLINQELLVTFSLTERSFEQSKLYDQSAQSALKAKTNYITQFEVGQKDLLSILDAEGEFFFSATEREVRSVDALLGQYRLLALTGELLSELGINTNELMVDTTKNASNKSPLWSFSPSTLDTEEALQGTTLTTK